MKNKKKPAFKSTTTWLDQHLQSADKSAKIVVPRPKSIEGVKITILGCGSSTGTPLFGCRCKTCISKNPRNQRSRASIYIQVKDKTFLIDTSTDLRTQALREKITWVDTVLFTHAHADHLHGIDELRSFNFIMRESIPCYGSQITINAIASKFDYIFTYSQEGGGKPSIDLHKIDKPVNIQSIRVVPISVAHGKINVLGYRIENVAYITDCSFISKSALNKLKGLDVLILDCLRPALHETHINIDQAIEYAIKIKAKKTIFTHMTHEIEYESFKKELAKKYKKYKLEPAFDGMKVHTK